MLRGQLCDFGLSTSFGLPPQGHVAPQAGCDSRVQGAKATAAWDIWAFASFAYEIYSPPGEKPSSAASCEMS
jgi:hypothetical protein